MIIQLISSNRPKELLILVKRSPTIKKIIMKETKKVYNEFIRIISL